MSQATNDLHTASSALANRVEELERRVYNLTKAVEGLKKSKTPARKKAVEDKAWPVFREHWVERGDF